MTIAGKIRSGTKLAIFARNHREFIERAVEISATDPNRRITFRAARPWTSACAAVRQNGPLNLYLSPIGGDGTIEYVATLHAVHVHPEAGDGETDGLLEWCLEENQHEGLWGRSEARVETLYVISNCRRIERPFPMTQLTKASNGETIDKNYARAYSIVEEVPAG